MPSIPSSGRNIAPGPEFSHEKSMQCIHGRVCEGTPIDQQHDWVFEFHGASFEEWALPGRPFPTHQGNMECQYDSRRMVWRQREGQDADEDKFAAWGNGHL